MGVDLDQHALGGMDVNLQKTGFIQRRIQKCEKTLMCDVWSSVGNISACLCEDTLVIVTVQKSVFGFFARLVLPTGAG